MKRKANLGWSLLLMAVFAIPTVARAQTQDEGTAYANYYAEPDMKTKAAMGEKFISDFKTSQYADAVFRGIIQINSKLNNFPKVIELAGTTEQRFPSMKPEDKAQVYSYAMQAAQQSNNGAQTIAFGEKVIAIAPEDLNTLLTLSSTIPYVMPKDAAAIAKAEQYAQKGMVVLAKFDPKAVGLSDADWAKQKVGIEGSFHNTLGSIYFNKADYDKAADELQAATKCTPKDGSSWYLLGLAFNQQYASQGKTYTEAVEKSNAAIKTKDQVLIEEGKATVAALEQNLREKRDQAIDALATAVALGGATQEQAMAQLKKLYANKNNGSTTGLDQLITSKKPAQ